MDKKQAWREVCPAPWSKYKTDDEAQASWDANEIFCTPFPSRSGRMGLHGDYVNKREIPDNVAVRLIFPDNQARCWLWLQNRLETWEMADGPLGHLND